MPAIFTRPYIVGSVKKQCILSTEDTLQDSHKRKVICLFPMCKPFLLVLAPKSHERTLLDYSHLLAV